VNSTTVQGDLDDYERVDEDRLRDQAATTKSRSLARLLAVADEWREAGCTPVFIIAREDPTIIACVAEETFGKAYQ
jgi:hypothetical protein